MKDKIYISIIFTLAILLSFRECNPKIKESVKEVIKYDTVTITKQLPAPKTDTVFLNRDVYKRVIIKEKVTEEIDTSAIINEFLKTKIYTRTLKDDSVAYVSMTDTVCGNTLLGGVFTYKHRAPIVIERTKTVFKPHGGLLLGFTTNISDESDLFVSGLYLSPNKGAYQIGYSPISKTIEVGIFFRIFN
jgi:hypothetical protein